MSVTFIIPTINRTTLRRTLESLLDQTDPNWMAMVVADHVAGFSLPIVDERIFEFNCPDQKYGNGHFSGVVRNIGMAMISGEWIAFVDDDDTIDPQYVEWLRSEGTDYDLFIFRMRYHPPREDNVTILPRPNCGLEGLRDGEVGISFAIRERFQMSKNLWFTTEEFEDWIFIRNAMNSGARTFLSKHIAYFVRHEKADSDSFT